jgi:hypothetical protein
LPHAAELPGPVELGMGATVVGLGVGIAVVETPTFGQPPLGDRQIWSPTMGPMDWQYRPNSGLIDISWTVVTRVPVIVFDWAEMDSHVSFVFTV